MKAGASNLIRRRGHAASMLLVAVLGMCAMAAPAEPLPLPHAIPHCFSPALTPQLGDWRSRVERALKDFLNDAKAFNARPAS
jgi:hypothetical protein